MEEIGDCFGDVEPAGGVESRLSGFIDNIDLDVFLTKEIFPYLRMIVSDCSSETPPGHVVHVDLLDDGQHHHHQIARLTGLKKLFLEGHFVVEMLRVE